MKNICVEEERSNALYMKMKLESERIYYKNLLNENLEAFKKCFKTFKLKPLEFVSHLSCVEILDNNHKGCFYTIAAHISGKDGESITFSLELTTKCDELKNETKALVLDFMKVKRFESNIKYFDILSDFLNEHLSEF